jgi:ubiquinone/menaquinone biosynthesis C-methylase UbiE
MERIPEPELMDSVDEAQAYSAADFSEVNQAFVDRLLDFVGDESSRQLVDLGCGPADIPKRIAQARPTWHIVAVDASQAMLDIARHDLNAAGVLDRVVLVLADAKNTGLPEHSFDVVLSNSILHHVADPLAFWREVVRLGKPGGLVLIRDLVRPESSEDAWELVKNYAGRESQLLQEEFHRSLLSSYSVDEVRHQLNEVGLNHFGVELVSDRHLDVFGRLD